MADINNLGRDWGDEVTTATDMVAQAQDGVVAITTQSPASTPRGILLQPGDSIVIKSGVTFRARAKSNFGVTALAMEAL